MLVTETRPRSLKWFHAGPLLYGDWGTSRLYVLGLAFFFTGVESVFYLVAIGALMAGVSWAYTIVCRAFPDGGGVYTAARQINPIYAVLGATLLLCGYIITAAISVVEALHYFGVAEGPVLVGLAILIIAFIGGVNWLGAKSAGRFALLVAIAALAVSGIMLLLVLPYLPAGLGRIHFNPGRGLWPHWTSFTGIVLALAGVEAVANMTGLMKRPVARTARHTIWPVLAEVAILNLVFGVAMTGMMASLPALDGLPTPLAQMSAEQLDALAGTDPAVLDTVEQVKNTSMKLIAEVSATNALGPGLGRAFGHVAGWVFALLLLSATNTAIMAMVSVLFAMAQDGEIPKRLTKLNYSGVPWIGLVVSCVVSVAVILVERRPEKLAELYIIGVCGAITTTVLSCGFNAALKVSRIERAGLLVLGSFLLAITLTILGTKPNAMAFAGIVVGIVLGTRAGLKMYRRAQPEPVPEPEIGWLAQVAAAPAKIDPSKPKIMLAARGRYQAEFAVDMARRREATLFAIFVRTLRVMDLQPGRVPRIEEDPDAQAALGATALLAAEAGVPFVPIYVSSAEIAEEILDYTVTQGCDTLIMGKSRRSIFARKLEGDVVTRVHDQLPEGVQLITRPAQTPHQAPKKADGQPPNRPEDAESEAPTDSED